MTKHRVSKTVTIENVDHADEVTVHLELDVECGCVAAAGSYTRSDVLTR